MNANVVHTVAKQLSIEELQLLYNLIGKDLEILNIIKKPKKEPLITPSEARKYLLENIFNIKS